MSSLFGSEPKPRSYADRARDGLASLGQKASDAQFEAEGLLGLRPKTAEEQLYEACCPSLSYQTRLIGFCACMFASFILALFASFICAGSYGAATRGPSPSRTRWITSWPFWAPCSWRDRRRS